MPYLTGTMDNPLFLHLLAYSNQSYWSNYEVTRKNNYLYEAFQNIMYFATVKFLQPEINKNGKISGTWDNLWEE